MSHMKTKLSPQMTQALLAFNAIMARAEISQLRELAVARAEKTSPGHPDEELFQTTWDRNAD